MQRREIGIRQCYTEQVRNGFQVPFHRCAGSTPYLGLPTLPEIIDQELATSRRWFEWEGGQGALDSPRQRLLRAHRNDPPQPVDLREFPYHEYLGLNHWPGAHLKETK